MSARDWLEERLGYRAAVARLEAPIPGGPSWLRTLGPIIGFLLVVELVTGIVMSMFYSPSVTDAWASVAYLNDQVAMGSLVRGVHRWGMSAIILAIGMHLVATAVTGAYRRPREPVWWLGIGLFMLALGYSVSGFVLRWDQYGYWATKVELAYVQNGPMGDTIVSAAQGGNDFGNLTLTRFYGIHVALLPALTVLLLWGHRALARKHGPAAPTGAPRRGRDWPDQAVRNLSAMALVLVALVAWSVHAGGAGLDAPADPTAAYDARPQWYFRPMYQLQHYLSGPGKLFAVLGLPAIIVGGLVVLPLVDRGAVRSKAIKLAVIVGLVLGLGGGAALTFLSYRVDARDEGLKERTAEADHQALRARRLAKANGVPSPGGVAVFTTAPFYTARTAWARECAGCHEGDDRKGPLIGPGYNDRAWIRGVLEDPAHDLYFGRTKMVKAEDAMPKTVARPEDLDALVEWLYGETGAADADKAKVARGQAVFDSDDDDGDEEDDEGTCTACHERTGTEASSGPNLAGRGTKAWLKSVIADPGAEHHFGAKDEMKAMVDKVTPAELAALVDYLAWLQTATKADVDKLDE